jgi:Kdo2-lipid IVA lauroyltransferase/acyltransferase
MSVSERRKVVFGVFENLGRLLAEFSHFPRLNASNIAKVVVYDGFENYAAAIGNGKGVLYLTAHFGAWELCSFSHASYGHPLKFVVRPMDNPLIDTLVNHYRTLSGNQTIEKKNSLKEILLTLKKNGAVGILVDQNTTRDAGIFANFFNVPACTTPSIVSIALRTGATIILAALIWDRLLRKHRLLFGPPVELIKTGDVQKDIQLNTEKCNQILEELICKYPDQWLWVHRRWKTRPEGKASLY